MTNHPSLVAEFIQYDYTDSFYTILFQCAVADLVKAENDHGNPTTIIRYWTTYTSNDGKPVLLSFGLRDGIIVRSIIVSPIICQWGFMIDIVNGKLIAPSIETVFPLMFEQSKNGLPEGVKFDACNLRRPPMNNKN